LLVAVVVVTYCQNEERALNLRFKENTLGLHFAWQDKATLQKEGTLHRFQQLFQHFSVFIGHYAFGIHEITSPRPFIYITMLRNPIDRVVSQFKWWQRLYDDTHGQNLVDFALNESYHPDTEII